MVIVIYISVMIVTVSVVGTEKDLHQFQEKHIQIEINNHMTPFEKLREEWNKHWRTDSADEIYPINEKVADWWLKKFSEHTEAIIKIGEKLEKNFRPVNHISPEDAFNGAYNTALHEFITAIKQASQ